MSYPQVLLTPRPQRVCTFLTSGVDSAITNTWTFSGLSLGTAQSDRIIVIGLGSSNYPEANYAVSDVTIGGVSATFIGRYDVGDPVYWESELWYVVVPTGTTGNLVVDWFGTTHGLVYGLWSITGCLSSLPAQWPQTTNYHAGYGANGSGISDRVDNFGNNPIYTGGVSVWLGGGVNITTSNNGTKDYTHADKLLFLL